MLKELLNFECLQTFNLRKTKKGEKLKLKLILPKRPPTNYHTLGRLLSKNNMKVNNLLDWDDIFRTGVAYSGNLSQGSYKITIDGIYNTDSGELILNTKNTNSSDTFNLIKIVHEYISKEKLTSRYDLNY